MTIYTSLKERSPRIDEIQSRALTNWRGHGCEIRCLPGPVDFRTVATSAAKEPSSVIAWVNADIYFEKIPITAIEGFLRGRTEWLVVGKRIDERQDGRRDYHKPSAIDYFIFPSGMFLDVPKITMGRGYCDSAIVAYCLRRGIPVIDATQMIQAIHQWHDYAHHSEGRLGVMVGDDAQENLRENRLRAFAPHISDSTHRLTERGLAVNARSPLRMLEFWGFYRNGWGWWPNFNQIWNILHRGGSGIG